jgi:LemA protein
MAMQGLLSADAALGAGLGRLLAIAEAYPQLKADATIKQLTEELASTENRIAFARQGYNDAVMAYNIGREQVPTSFIAAACNFRPAIPYEIEDASQRITPVVSL